MKSQLAALSVWALLVSGCPGPAPTPPARTPPRRAGEQAGLAAAGAEVAPDTELGAAGAATNSVPVAAQGGSASPLTAQGGAAAKPADSITVSGWWCYSWVHGRDFASPCFASARACTGAKTKDAHGDKMPCAVYSGVVFCSPAVAPGAPSPSAPRCFQEPGRGS